MDSVCLQEPSADLRVHPRPTAGRGIARLAAACAVLVAGIAAPVHAQNFKVGSFVKPAAVTVKNAATASVGAALTVTIPLFNPGTGTNRLLVVGLSSSGTLTALTLTYGVTALTLVPASSAANGATRTALYYLLSPSSTAANIVATWTTTTRDVVMGAVAFDDVDQVTPIQNAIFATGNTTTPLVTVVSGVGNMTMAIAARLTNLGAPTQTQRWLDITRANIKGSGSTAVGAASVIHGSVASGVPTLWSSSGISIKRASGLANVVAHGLGAVPSALMMWTSGSTTGTGFGSSDWSAFGMSDGTTSYSTSKSSRGGVTPSSASRRAAAKALTIVQYGQVLLAEADLTSWDATNINLTWSSNSAGASVIHYLAISGVSAKVLTWKPSAGAGDKIVNTVGFHPNVVFHMGDSESVAAPSSVADGAFNLGVMDSDGKQWTTSVFSQSGVGTSNTERSQRTDACIEEINGSGVTQTRASWKSMDPLGFTVNYSLNPSANNVYSLALAGLNLQAGSFNKLQGQFVQQASKNAGISAGTTQTFPNSSTSGNLIVVTVLYDTSAGATSISSIIDNKGNTYNLALGPTNWGPGGAAHTSTYYATNITGGGAAITITVTLAAPTGFALEVFQTEYAGLATVAPVDRTSAAFGNSVSPINSGSQTTTQTNELIYGFAGTVNGGVTGGSTYATRSNFTAQFLGDKTVSATGPYNVDATFAGTQDWVAHMVTFKASPNANLKPPQVFTGLGFQPIAMFFASNQAITQGVNPVAHARMGIGASDGTTDGAAAFQDTDALGTTDVENFDSTSKVFAKVDNNISLVDAEADLTSLDADGFTLNWTTNDWAATEMLYVGFGKMWLTEVRLIPGSFTGEKYPSGALLQWRTGYEADNLGFNLYREINGVRTRVNSTLIAGSGLQGGGVATRSYARWDTDPAANGPGVTYWLEDVEFNGRNTWHGPVTAVVSQLQEPTTADSPELGNGSNAENSRRIFFNYNEDPAHPGPRVVPAQVEPEVTRQWALAAQATVKLGIRKPGWYRVTRDELVAGGLGAQVDPLTLQLFVDGTEQAIRVNGQTGSSFAAIEFYGAGIDTQHTDTRTYWLRAGVESGLRIAVDAGGSSEPSMLTGFASTLRRKDRSIYAAAIKNGDAENWFGPMLFWEPVPDPEGGSPILTLTPHNIDHSAAGPAQLTVTLQGVTIAPDGSGNHRIGVLVNGTDVGEMTFAGQANADHTFPVGMGVLSDGVNLVTFDVRGGDPTTDSSMVDAIRLDYPHTYQADADRLRFMVDAPVSITVGGFASASIRVFDITDRAAPLELPPTIGTASGLSTVTVHVPGSGTRTLLAFSDETVSSPAFVRTNHPSSWHTSSNAHDYVVVSHADFVSQVAPLATLRQQQGRHAVVVDIEDVYDEFSFGEKTPQAIKDFLQWARTNWTIAPKFVVLAGDATIDPRDYEGLGDADFVPTKQVTMNQATLETASDDWFVDFSGTGLPEIAIGRLPVRTAAQAQTTVAKIVGYDQAVPQPWMNDVLLVADQNDANADFEQSSNNLSKLLPPGYRANTVYRGVLGDAPAHQALMDGVNNGQLIVNYTGHGSTGIWSALLTRADVTGSWTNAAKLPFVVAMNCLNGLFNALYGEDDDEASLAETMVRAPNGGAVAVWASSSATPSADQARVNQELFRLIFTGTYATVGEAVAAAKRVVSNQDVRRSWIFFGDPAMRLSGAPQPGITSPPVITTQPHGMPMESGQQAGLEVVATGNAPLSYQWYIGASGQTTHRIGGATSSAFTTPAVTNTTSYWARVSNPYGSADSEAAVISMAALIASPATIAPGGTLTVMWAGISVPSATDWVAFVPVGAADAAYVAWEYTNGASGGSKSLTIPASVMPGTYDLRLFAQNSWQRLVVSEPVTVAVTVGTLTASPTTIAPGGTLTVTWADIGAPSATDWVALVPVGAADATYVAWKYTNGASGGSTSLPISASVLPGAYDLRLFAQNSWQRLAVSEPVTVAVPVVTLTASPAEVAPGGALTVTWQGQSTSSATDWLALVPVNAPDSSYVAWVYATGRPSDSTLFLLPDALMAGLYEVRLFANNTYTVLAVSNSLTVTAPGPSLIASPVATAPGGTVAMAWRNIAAPTELDWVGLYAVEAADADHITRWYTTGRASDRLLKALPGSLADGSYELRLFANDTWTRLATGNAFSVAAGPSVTASPVALAPGETATVTWTGIASPTPTDWVALVPLNAPDGSYVAWGYTTGAASGSVGLLISGSAAPGAYQLRVFANNSWQRLAVSNIIVVGPTLTVNPTSVAPGGTVTVTWAGISTPASTDWLALVPISASDSSYVAWVYTNGSAGDSLPFVLPSNLPPGKYDLRLFAHNSWERLALSNIVIVP